MSVRAALLICLVLAAAEVAAADSPSETKRESANEYAIDIPRMELSAALDVLMKQTHVQLFILGDRSSLLSTPVKGSYTIRSALALLLKNTGAIYGRGTDDQYWVRLPEAPLEDAAEPPRVSGVPSPFSAEMAMEELVVFGGSLRRWRPSDLEAWGPPYDADAPRVVMSPKVISGVAPSSVAELMEYIPLQSFATPGERSRDAEYPQLRGLGATLVLINARRVVPTSGDWADTFALSTIPIFALEHVEVIAAPASIAVSSRSTAGLVNVMLKKQIRAPTLELQYGTANGGGAERRISFGAGIDGNRLRGTVVFEYFDREPLLGAARDLWSNQDFRRFGGRDFRSSDASPGNISSLGPGPLPGLPSNFAAVPAQGGTRIEDFLATASTLNESSLAQYQSVRPAARRYNVAGSAQISFSNVTAFGELLCARREIAEQSHPPTLSVDVPATNPFNLFRVPVRADVLVAELPPLRTETLSTLLRPVIGARGVLGSLNWELSLAQSVERGSTTVSGDLDPQLVGQALAQSDPRLSLNLFQAGPVNSPELLAALVRAPEVARYSVQGTLASASLRGPAIRTPVGEVEMSLGAEWETLRTSFEDLKDFGSTLR